MLYKAADRSIQNTIDNSFSQRGNRVLPQSAIKHQKNIMHRHTSGRYEQGDKNNAIHKPKEAIQRQPD
ncbi:hypothetical protein DBR32_14725 [Taibaiella sp. KBW10]|nr:hypothetical protein DBR32_14725 [Taibaiella sp. KBW10]